MLKEERLDHILQKLAKNRKVTLSELSADLNVSEDTARRDIEALARNARLIKVRGGAVPHSPNINAHAFKDRMHLSETDKEIIAVKALHLLHPGQAILLDGGTTTYTMARMLPGDMQLTVVTNSIPIAASLMEHPLVEVVFVGGRIFKSSQVTVGIEAIDLLKRLRVDICFTGICSLHQEFGISGPHLDETDVKRAMVQSANSVVAVTTINKIGTAETFKVCDIEQVGTIITEADPEIEMFIPYRNLGITVL
jgi:DeoR/GlpR family transcriptional regulator of sugar metabolism